MSLTFDHSVTEIYINSPQTALDVQTLYNDICAEEASERGVTYPGIATASGKDSLGGAVQTGLTMKLLDTWKIEWYAGNYVASVDGGNIVANSGNPFTYVVGGPQIEIMRSAAATVVSTGGSALTSDEHSQLMNLPAASSNAAAVWAKAIEGSLTAEQAQRLLLSVLAGKVSGAGTGTEVFRDLADTKARVTVTTDSSGNRTAVVRDAA